MPFKHRAEQQSELQRFRARPPPLVGPAFPWIVESALKCSDGDKKPWASPGSTYQPDQNVPRNQGILNNERH